MRVVGGHVGGVVRAALGVVHHGEVLARLHDAGGRVAQDAAACSDDVQRAQHIGGVRPARTRKGV